MISMRLGAYRSKTNPHHVSSCVTMAWRGKGNTYTYHISDPVSMTSEPPNHLPATSIRNAHCEVVSSNGKHTAAQEYTFRFYCIIMCACMFLQLY